jgi:cell division septal protein FtsQ
MHKLNGNGNGNLQEGTETWNQIERVKRGLRPVLWLYAVFWAALVLVLVLLSIYRVWNFDQLNELRGTLQ